MAQELDFILLLNQCQNKWLPIYDKPMIYYPMLVLMLDDIRDIFIISTPRYIMNFRELFKAVSEFGLRIEYAIEKSPNG